MRREILITATVLAAVCLSGCYDPHAQDSRIVREVEAAGAGNLSSFTYQGLVDWFFKHPDVTKKIAGECAAVARTAPANWLTTAEGTTCHAAEVAAPPPQFKADQRTW